MQLNLILLYNSTTCALPGSVGKDKKGATLDHTVVTLNFAMTALNLVVRVVALLLSMLFTTSLLTLTSYYILGSAGAQALLDEVDKLLGKVQ